MSRSPYPLQWPEGWKRTVNRQGRGTSPGQAKFEGQFARDRDSVIRQLKRRGSNIVITSDLPTRNDGVPYADAFARDPGIAVYWVEKGHERVIACDRWKTHALNMRAIDLSLEALRGLDRWGASEMVERAFAGFAALPAGSGEEFIPQKKPAAGKNSSRRRSGRGATSSAASGPSSSIARRGIEAKGDKGQARALAEKVLGGWIDGNVEIGALSGLVVELLATNRSVGVWQNGYGADFTGAVKAFDLDLKKLPANASEKTTTKPGAKAKRKAGAK